MKGIGLPFAVAFGAFFGIAGAWFLVDKLGGLAPTIALAAFVGAACSALWAVPLSLATRGGRRLVDESFSEPAPALPSLQPPQVVVMPPYQAPLAPPVYEKGLGNSGLSEFSNSKGDEWKVL